MREELIDGFRAALRGQLILRGDEAYDEACKLYNGMIDKRPLMIARCADVADVTAAVNFARDNGLLLAVRGGGHSGPGLGSCDDGLVIDLSAMRGIRVDPAARTVRVEPGCRTGDVDHATARFGLAVPTGIIASTGIGGLTLGGGTGYLTRKHGLTIDNLIEADVVLADGRFVVASETENADLFWALRGGGGNFGVVTSFLFRAHPVSSVFAGAILWDIGHARQVMRAYRDFLPTASEELGAFVGLKGLPKADAFPAELQGRRVVGIVTCYDGTAEAGRKEIQPLLDELPEPLADWRMEMPFAAMQSSFDPLMPAGLQWYWKGDFVKELTDEAIDVHIAHAAEAPGEMSLMHLYPIDGAVRRVKPGATAWSARDATWSMVICGVDSNPQLAGQLTRWGRAYWEAVHPFNQPGAYVNFMMDDEDGGRVKASYGDNWRRLAEVKRRYDPANLFRVNQNITPLAA